MRRFPDHSRMPFLEWQSEWPPLPKNGLFTLWPSTNGEIPYFLVLPGSEFSITEITEYTSFSLSKSWLPGFHFLRDFAISWISRFPGFRFLLDFAICWIPRFPGFHSFLDFTFCWISQFPGCHNFLDFTFCWVSPFAGLHDFLDVAFAGFRHFQDVAISAMWHVPGRIRDLEFSSSVDSMYACSRCIRAGHYSHTSRYWARWQLRPHWPSRGARPPGAAPGSLSLPCRVCITRSLARFSAWTSSCWCHKARPPSVIIFTDRFFCIVHLFKSDGLPAAAQRPWRKWFQTRRKKISRQNSEAINI